MRKRIISALMELLRIFTFGGLRIERKGQSPQLPTHKARELAAYLVTFRSCPHPRSTLAGILWPDIPEEKARRRLSDTLWRIRHVLGDYVTADEDYVRFNFALPHWLDAQEFEQKASKYANAQAENASSVCLPELCEAVDLYTGTFLEGFYQDWVLGEQERLRGLYLELLGQLLEQYKQSGDYAAALATAQRLVATERLHEFGHRELMRLYHLLGRDTEAITQYQYCQEILKAELGVDPAPETESLYQILIHPAPDQVNAPTVHLPMPARPSVLNLDELPLVGRDAERNALLRHIEAIASGQGGIVLLEGEAGIGKSRLVRELGAGASWRTICTTWASASEIKASSPYALLLEAMKPVLPPLRIRQLSRLIERVHLQAVAPLLPEIAEVLPGLPPLPDLPPPQARERLQQALIALVLGLARITPHLWVLEDIHWADAETLALLPLLIPHLAASRALLLLTGRSADLRNNPTVWSTLQALDRTGPFTRYTLNRLKGKDVDWLVHNLVGEADPSLSERLAQASEGVPLYLIETLKTWRDEGRLWPTQQGNWQWKGDAPAALPSHLGEAVVGYRLSRLSGAAHQVLGAAAVIGAEVDFDLLAQVCGHAASLPTDLYLLPATDELLSLGLLLETDTGYHFSHEQVRQAVYHQLSAAQRQRLHRDTAKALEALAADQSELLAYHFAAAGEQQPAIDYLIRAAERARKLFAHQAALTCYNRLLDLTNPKDHPACFNILHDRAEVLGWIGDREAQGRDLEKLLDLARALGDKTRLAFALHQRSEWRRVQGHYPPADEDAQAALELYRQLEDRLAQAALLSQLGWNVVYTTNYSRALDYFRQALAIYQDSNDLEGQIGCLIGLMSAAELGGDYSHSLAYSQECMTLAQATGNPYHIARAFFSVGLKCFDLGDVQAAKGYLQESLRLNETIGERRQQAAVHLYLGETIIERGDLETAQAHIETAHSLFRQMRDLSWEGDALAALGRLAILQGAPDVAHEHLRAAYQRRTELGEPGYAVLDLSFMALAELMQGDKRHAWQHSQQAVAELEAGLEGVEHYYRIYYNHFRVAEGVSRWAAARTAIERAARIVGEFAERVSDPIWQEKFRTAYHARQAIAEAVAVQPPPGCLRVRLARADAPGHRQPLPDETTFVVWNVDDGNADAAIAKREGKAALRRHRLRRLLAQAHATNAAPTIEDMAGALDVSPRTVRADLAALRRQGYTVRTRGTL